MWLFVATSVATRPAKPRMMCIGLRSAFFLFAEALQRLQHGQVVRIDAQRLLPSLAREVLVAEPFVKRTLHRQNVLVFGVLLVELGDLDERQFILAGLVEILHPGERHQVAVLAGGRLVVARLAGGALGGRLSLYVVTRRGALQAVAFGARWHVV